MINLNLDTGYAELVKYVLDTGRLVHPRGQMTLEIVNANLCVINPRERIVTHQGRKMNLAFGFAEFLECASGQNSLSAVLPFAPNMAKFSADGVTVDNAYGPRIVNEGFNQIDAVCEKIRQDVSTREAVIQIYRAEDILHKGPSIPCTISLQFLLRQGKLECIATMRSNDVVWGLTYDIFVFTMIQEYISMKLGVELGVYYHNAGSLHLYVDRDFKIIADLLNSKNDFDGDSLMPPMPDFVPLDIRSIYYFAGEEFYDIRMDQKVHPYWRDVHYLARYMHFRKKGKDIALAAKGGITQNLYLNMLRFYHE